MSAHADADRAGGDDEPRQPSLRRMRAFDVHPKRDLGQNFLVDSNILGVIARAADLREDDVVLEIGGGLGVLTEHLAQRVRHVHVVEVDPALEPALRDATDPFGDHISVHVADALDLDLPALDPTPTKVVANLPYGIAATALLKTIAELAAVTTWVAMVQKEVGARLAAATGTGTYGIPSVLAQLACDVRVHHKVARTVFAPVPNVDSVLVVLRRRSGAPAVDDDLRALVHAAFAHRRKALAGSLKLHPAFGAPAREAARSVLVELGHPADARAERLSPDDFRALAKALR